MDGDPIEDISVLGARPSIFKAKPRGKGVATMPFIMKDGVIYRVAL